MSKAWLGAIAVLFSLSAHAIERGRLDFEMRFAGADVVFNQLDGFYGGHSGKMSGQIRTKAASGELREGAGLVEQAFGGMMNNEAGEGQFPLTPFGTTMTIQNEGSVIHLVARVAAQISAPPLTFSMNEQIPVDLQIVSGTWSDIETGGEVVAQASGDTARILAQKWISAMTKFRADMTNGLLTRMGEKAQLIMSASVTEAPKSVSCRFTKGAAACHLDGWNVDHRTVMVMD